MGGVHGPPRPGAHAPAVPTGFTEDGMRASHAWEETSDGSSTRTGCFSCLLFLRRRPRALEHNRGAHAEAVLGFSPPVSNGTKSSDFSFVAAGATQGLDQPATIVAVDGETLARSADRALIPGLQIEEDEDGEGGISGLGAASHGPESKEPTNDTDRSRRSDEQAFEIPEITLVVVPPPPSEKNTPSAGPRNAL